MHQRALDAPQAVRCPSAGGTRHSDTPVLVARSRTARRRVQFQCFVQFITPDRPPRRGAARPSADTHVRRPVRHCRLVQCSAGGRTPLIDRYALPEIAGLFTDEARFAHLARGRDPGHRGLGQARRRPRRRRRRHPGAGRLRPSPRSTSGSASPSTTSPPSSTSSQERIGRPGGARGSTTASRRATSSTPPCRVTLVRAVRSVIDAAADARGARSPPQAREHRDTPMVGRTHGIHAEPTTFGAKLALWALQVRRDRERLAPGPRGRSRSASCRARSAPTPTSTPRSRRTCASGSGCSRCRPRRCSPATATPSCSTRARRVGAVDRGVRARDPPPPAHRGAARSRSRSAPARRRARARCRTSATR